MPQGHIRQESISLSARLPFFISTESQPRALRPADAMTLVLGCLLVGLGLFRIGRSGPWEEAGTRLIAYLGPSAGSLWALVYTFGLLFALAVLIAVLAGGRKRRHAARDVVFAALLSVLLSTLLSFVANRAWPYVLPELGLEDPTPRFPVLRVAIVAAVLVASGPHLTRPMRRLGWVTVFLTAFASVGLRYGDPSDAIGAFGIGLVAAGGILLAYGSPPRRDGLAAVSRITFTSAQQGSRCFEAR